MGLFENFSLNVMSNSNILFVLKNFAHTADGFRQTEELTKTNFLKRKDITED